MHIIMDTVAIKDAIDTVTRALSPHSAISILEGIYMEALGNEVLFKCTDLSLQIETIVPAEVVEDGGIVLPGRLLSDMVRRMPGEKVEIETDKVTAHIKSDRAEFNVQGERIEEYHSMPAVKKELAVTIGMDVFRGMIRQCTFATAQDESKPILTGVLMEIDEGTLGMVALDGYRLAMIHRAIEGGEAHTAVAPAKSLLEIGKILGDSQDKINVTLSRTHVLIDMGGTKIITRLLDGEFIKYKQILPTDHTLRVRVNRGEMLNTIDRAALVAREGKSNIVKFEFDKDMLVVSANSEIGKAREELEVQCMGEALDIAFNAKYFTDVLKALEDEYVYLDMNNSISPCVVRPIQGDDFYYLILPVRLYA